MGIRLLKRLAAALAFVACDSCVPLNSSARDVVGRWQVECEGGKETLDLQPDAHYVYTVESPRSHLKIEGAWEIGAAGQSLESANVILHTGPRICEQAGTSKDAPAGDVRLAPVWEW